MIYVKNNQIVILFVQLNPILSIFTKYIHHYELINKIKFYVKDIFVYNSNK